MDWKSTFYGSSSTFLEIKNGRIWDIQKLILTFINNINKYHSNILGKKAVWPILQ